MQRVRVAAHHRPKIMNKRTSLVVFTLSDNDGPYYWHIKSGTIQRDPPEFTYGKNEPKTPLVKDAETVSAFSFDVTKSTCNATSFIPRVCSDSHIMKGVLEFNSNYFIAYYLPGY